MVRVTGVGGRECAGGNASVGVPLLVEGCVQETGVWAGHQGERAQAREDGADPGRSRSARQRPV